jgi:nucleotide-binding universal stress UspA family protein
MLSTIAVATDGSQTAQHAVDAAFDLAQRFGAGVVVLTAYSIDRRESGGWRANEATQAERVLEDAVEAAEALGLSCTSAMLEGDPAQVLITLAARHGADLLVVGNKGMERRVLGSVPNTVTHKASCSVLVVKTA